MISKYFSVHLFADAGNLYIAKNVCKLYVTEALHAVLLLKEWPPWQFVVFINMISCSRK